MIHVRLVPLDLRWGVTEEEAEQRKTLEICLDEIDRARPFFVGILGERYGWVPPQNEDFRTRPIRLVEGSGAVWPLDHSSRDRPRCAAS